MQQTLVYTGIMTPREAVKAISRIMKYCVDTKNRGWMLQPNRTWDGIDLTFFNA